MLVRVPSWSARWDCPGHTRIPADTPELRVIAALNRLAHARYQQALRLLTRYHSGFCPSVFSGNSRFTAAQGSLPEAEDRVVLSRNESNHSFRAFVQAGMCIPAWMERALARQGAGYSLDEWVLASVAADYSAEYHQAKATWSALAEEAKAASGGSFILPATCGYGWGANPICL